MAVQPQTPFKEYTANGTTTVFPLDFDCENKDHLIVMIDDAETDNSTWSLNNKQVTFNAAPAAGKKITLQRNTPFSRTTDYQSFNNSFRPQNVNGDFDRLWLKLQELGVANWLMKQYVDKKDDELKAYLMEEIRKQGVALDQLDEYYDYLMERLAQIAVDKGWSADFVVDGDKNQHQINEEQKAQNNSFKSKIRKTPYDFGAKGGDNDDTASVKACIESGYFLINDIHNCRPFKIENKNINGEFSDKGRLIAIPTEGIDTIEFINCSGEIRSWYMTEDYTVGVYVSFLLRKCKNMDVYRLFVTGGKLVPVAMVDCDECFIYNSAGIGFVEQRPFEWALVGSRNSQYINCHLYNHQFGFVIIGSAYKSGTRLMTTRSILETLGMKAVGCTVNNATRTCFDINGAVGAEFLDCTADQQGQSLASPGFQIKQSTVVPEESGLDTYMNKITNPTAINCTVALNMQDGHIAKITNLTAINIKTSVLQLNKTPRCEIDGVYVYNFGLDLVNHSSMSGKANVLHLQNSSGNCVIRNVNVVIDRPLSNPSLVEFISNTSNNTTIDGFKVTLLNSTDVFKKFIVNSGNYLKLIGDFRIGSPASYETLVDDTASSTIYPVAISKVFDLSGPSEVMYFDQMQSNGLAVGKVATTALDVSGSDAQISVGISGNVAGLRDLGAVAAGTSVNNPNTIKSIVGNTPIVCRRQVGTTGTGKVLVQIRGFDLL